MTLSRYLSRRFLQALLVTAGGFGLLIAAVEALELSGNLRGVPNAGAGTALQLTALVLPGRLYEIGPLIALLASLALFMSMSRSSEITVARTSGRSSLGVVGAPVAVVLALGAFLVAAMNPIVAATLRKAETVEARIDGSANVLSISPDGLWLRQGSAGGQTVIRARSASLDGERLAEVTFLSYDASGPAERIEARSARLVPGNWELDGAKRWDLTAPNPEAAAETADRMRLPTDLTVERIRDGFGTPEAVGIWDLPTYIADLEAAGFTARSYRLRLWSEIASPLFLAAMVITGAAFALRHARAGGAWIRGTAAVATGFALYSTKNFALALGQSGQAPVLLASLAPPAATLALAAAIVLWMEDA